MEDSKEDISNKINLSFKDFLSGNILTRKFIAKHIKLFVTIIIISVVYINNKYKTESVMVEIMDLQEEVKELRNRSISYATELMSLSRESEVIKMVQEKELEIKELKLPPQKISIEK